VTLADTLDRAAADGARGDLGKARSRLEGLLQAYPAELIIRRRLGEVFWQLQYPERAGRYWYMFEDETPEMAAAKRAFEGRYGGDAWRMLDAIGFHGGLDSLSGTYADGVIRDLAKRSGVTPGRLEAALRRSNPNEPASPVLEPWWSRLVPVVLLVVLGAVLLLAVIGAIVASSWAWNALAS